MTSFEVTGHGIGYFTDRVAGSNQGTGDIWTLQLSIYIPDEANWTALLALVTTKYSIHVPLGGAAVIDVVNGPGEGQLICSFGVTTAILGDLKREQYLPSHRSIATANFLITNVWGALP